MVSAEQIYSEAVSRKWISPSPDPVYECQKCKDKGGFNFKRKTGIGVYDFFEPCECQERKRMQELIEKSGMEEVFKKSYFDDFKPWDGRAAQAKGTAEAYVLDFVNIEHTKQNSLALLGAVGSGKTLLGSCVLNALMTKGVGVLYTGYRDMVQELKFTVTDSLEHSAALKKYKSSRVLFIDDLYKGMTDTDPKYVYDVINARYSEKMPVIITSEYDATRITEIEPATGSRIIEMCRDYIYELRGEGLNYRLRGV